MSTTSSVCQGLQSCLEPILMKPRVLMHQLVPSKQTLSLPWPPEPEESLNCWNVKHSPSPTKSIDETERVYVHPLSTKSLEMCTESLGSETGSLVDSSVDEYSRQKQSPNVVKAAKTTKKARQSSSSFPPPLTSISGSEGVQVQTHREGGRLVIKAFTYSCCSLYFQAERQNGRLRLSLMKDGGLDEEVDQENVEKDCEEGGDLSGSFWGEVDQENVDDEGGELRGGFWGENMKDDQGGKIGWSSKRCNDDRSKRLPSLQFFGVAIS